LRNKRQGLERYTGSQTENKVGIFH